MNWKVDKKWSDRFLVDIKRILGEHLIAEPPIEEDAERNTDLMVLNLQGVRVGCRVRKYQYFDRYKTDFTIRAGRPNGTKTELQKIIEGWGDYFFYGFADQDESGLFAWALSDLKVFRRWYSENLSVGQPGARKDNHDGSSSFMTFRWRDMPKGFVIASSRG